MTDFNSLPLTEQLKALEPGDELHLCGGGWLPFEGYLDSISTTFPIRGKEICWTWDGKYYDTPMHPLDIIRVVRPGEKREVPEIVELLRLEIQDLSEDMTANAWMNND